MEGTGLLYSVQLDAAHLPVVAETGIEMSLRRAGINVIHGGRNALRFTPNLTVTKAEIDMQVAHLDRVLPVPATPVPVYRYTGIFAKFCRARSRLYQNEILQVNTKYAFESIFQALQDLHTFAPLRNNHFRKNRFEKKAIFAKFQQKVWTFCKPYHLPKF